MLNDPLLIASPAGSRHRAGEVGQPRTSSRPRRSGLLNHLQRNRAGRPRWHVDPASGCWLWADGRGTDGYGRIRIAGKTVSAHRVVYEAYVGPIPAGMEIDHLCRVRACVNPAHLEAVTPLVNKMRSDAPSAHNALKTHCINGHEFSEANTRLRPRRHPNGGPMRDCRACDRDRHRRRRQALAVSRRRDIAITIVGLALVTAATRARIERTVVAVWAVGMLLLIGLRGFS